MNDEPKSNINFGLHNKHAFEAILSKQLKEACEKLSISFDEWDLDEHLCRALTRALHREFKTDSKLQRVVATFDKYDKFYELALELGISIDTKFEWFFKLTNQIIH